MKNIIYSYVNHMGLHRLEHSIEDVCKKQPFKVGLCVKYCDSNEVCSINGDDIFSSGSVRKIVILMAALKAVYDGKVSLHKKITIQKKFQKNRSGCLRYLQPGLSLTFQDTLTLMIIVSDNTCTGHIVDLLGVSYVNQYCKSIGLKHTKILRGFPPLGKEDLKKYMDITTPNDTAYLLGLILDGSKNDLDAKRLGCNKPLCQLALDILSHQMLNTELPLLLPDNTKVAHKTGSRKGVNNDAGIIYYKGKPLFILTILTQQNSKYIPPMSETSIFIAQLSRRYFDYFTKLGGNP